MLLNLDRGGHLILKHIMSNKQSLTVTEDEEGKKKQEIYMKLELMTQKVFFMQQIK